MKHLTSPHLTIISNINTPPAMTLQIIKSLFLYIFLIFVLLNQKINKQDEDDARLLLPYPPLLSISIRKNISAVSLTGIGRRRLTIKS